MSFLSNLIKKAAPIVATVVPGTPIGTAAAVVTYGQAKQEQSYQQKLAEERQRKEQKKMSEFFGSNLAISLPIILTV